ncbi:MAG TPA: hypothetical protein VM364_13485 [Vicinamibacterales bacterium]|nr:hypothetical protein [Vicinamibacterales bacterium]
MRVVRVVAAAMLAFSVLWGPPAPVRAAQAAEEFTAIAANISNVGAAGLVPVTIHVSRWTPEEEHARLFDILRESGQEAFLKALLQQKPVGWIATPTSLRYDFFYARQDQRDGGGRRIMLITDRPMNFSERVNAEPSREYPFTVVELHLDRQNRGEGTLSQLVQLRLLGDILGVENLASAPMRLNQVRRVK